MGPTIIGMPQREQTWFVKNKIEKPTYWENIQGESRPIWGNGAYDKKNQKLLSRYNGLINAEENNRLNKNNSIKVVNPFPDNKGRPGTANTVSQSPHSSYPEELSEKITELEKLPGVGRKTASVVVSQGFGIPAFPVDTHIHRLAQRWGLTNGKNVKTTENDLKRLFPKEKWNKLHLQIIFYGREFCSAWACDGTVCKICTTCYPKRKKAVKTKKS